MDKMANSSTALSGGVVPPSHGGPSDTTWTAACFSAGSVRLSLKQERKLARWIKERQRDSQRFRLIVIGGGNTSRSGRLRRLHALYALLKRLGVAASRIVLDPGWIKPERMGAPEDVPADAIWLHFRDLQPAP